MKSEYDLFEVSILGEAEKKLKDAFREKKPKKKSSNPAEDFVENKIVENTIVPNLDGKTTFGQLFKGWSELPPGINNVVDFKKWYMREEDPDNPLPLRKAA